MTRNLSLLVLLALAACARSHGNGPGSGGDSGRDSGTDSGRDSTPPIHCDAGPVATCERGACCDETAPAGGLCGNECPAGFSPFCLADAICGSELRDCTRTRECVLADMQCCGPCVRTLDNSTSVRRDRTGDYFDEGECLADCVGCPPQEPTDSRIVATCNANLCEAVSIRPSALTACTENADCRIRALECCACAFDTSPDNLAAVRVDSEASLSELLCDTDGPPCLECVPDFSEYVAFCATDGHCAFEREAP